MFLSLQKSKHLAMRRRAIIVAGGSGQRMGSSVPKQFMCVAGRPILMHTLEAFARTAEPMDIVLVLPQYEVERWDALCKEYGCTVEHSLVAGGATRFDSVKHALALVHSGELVAVHDGVRPLVSAATIERCFAAAEQYGAAVPCVDMVDSLRRCTAERSEACDRSQYKLVQTPQVFRSELLLEAYEQPYCATFTDDASVVERLGAKVHLVEGNRENIKITTPMDLTLAEALLGSVEC